MVLHNRIQNNFYVIDMDYPRAEHEETASSIRFNIYRQMIQGNEEEQISCIQFLKDELFLAYNINIVNLLSLQNASKSLKEALRLGVPQLIDCEGYSAFDNSLQLNSLNSINVLLEGQTQSSSTFV